MMLLSFLFLVTIAASTWPLSSMVFVEVSKTSTSERAAAAPCENGIQMGGMYRGQGGGKTTDEKARLLTRIPGAVGRGNRVRWKYDRESRRERWSEAGGVR